MELKLSDLPPELLSEIAAKLTNYSDYFNARSVCKSWEFAIQKRPNKLIRNLPLLLLPYYHAITDHRGIFNIATQRSHLLNFPEARGSHCCGSSNGWLIMVHESPNIFLINPLSRTRIDLPPITTLPSFPFQLIYQNSMSLCESFINREKLHLRDTFVAKGSLSEDPSASNDVVVAIIYGNDRNLAFCRLGDQTWTPIDGFSQGNDLIFHQDKLHAVNENGQIYCINYRRSNAATCMAHGPVSSPNGQLYLTILDGEFAVFARFRRVVPGYDYKTERFEAYKLENGDKWAKMESLGDSALFVGLSGSLCIDARDYSGIKGNAVYFTDDYMRVDQDFAWEGHDYGVYSFQHGCVESFDFPARLLPMEEQAPVDVFFYGQSMHRNTSVFVLPPPIWVTISP